MSLHFGSYKEVADAVAARIAGRQAEGDRLAAWLAQPVEVIVPSAAVGRAIASRLLELHAGGVAGIRLDTPERLALRILNAAGSFPRLATEAERRLAMRAAVRSCNDEMMQSRGIASMLERSYRDVRDRGLSLADFERKVRDSGRLRNRARTQLLIGVWKDYERFLSQMEAIDPADLLTRAADRITGGAAVRPQLLAGFYDMTGVQSRLIEALHHAGFIDAVFVPVAIDEHGVPPEPYRFAAPFAAKAARLGESGAPLGKIERHAETRRRGEDQPAAPRPSAPGPQPSITAHATKLDELRDACSQVATLLGDTDPLDLGIVARSVDPYDEALLRRFARKHGFRIAGDDSIPLKAHRLGRGIRLLLQLRERNFARTEVIELLRCGIDAGRSLNVDDLDVATRRSAIAGGTSAELAGLTVKWKPADVASYLAVVAGLERLTAPLERPLRAGVWATLLEELASHFTPASEVDLAAAQAFDAVVTTFRRASAIRTPFDLSTVLDAIDHAEVPKRIADDGEPLPEVWFGDVMKLRGRTFRHLFAVRMQDDLFPQRRTEDPLLPESDRRVLGLREVGNGRDEERLLFELLKDSATETVRFSFAATDGFGKLLRPSPLVKQLAIERDPLQRRAILHDFAKYVAELGTSTELGVILSEGDVGGCEAKDPEVESRGGRVATPSATEPGIQPRGPSPSSRLRMTPASHASSSELSPPPERDPVLLRKLQLALGAGSGSAFDGYLAPHPALVEKIRAVLSAVTPTQLEDFGECPHKFLMKAILGVRDFDDPDRDLQIDHRDKGTLDHRILERFYRELSSDELSGLAADLPELPEWAVEKLEAIVDQELSRYDAERPPFNRTLRAIERNKTKRNLRDFVALDVADLEAQRLRPQHFEYRFGPKHRHAPPDHPEPFRLDARGITLSVDGTIDRIDEGDGRYRIVDYKSGKALRHTKLDLKIDRGVRLQLALYAMAVAQFFGVEAEKVSGTIKPLVTLDLKPASFRFELADKDTVIRNTLDLFVEAILAGMFPAYPDDDACKYCPVNHSCRTRHDAEEKYAVLQQGDPQTLLARALGRSLEDAVE
jgi:RecB family exonuclease